ncbi:MAG: hypothetical protein IK118_05725 [Clostridia bacterium]|nr:hypothetical protein [Clostridia bacterium]
MKKILCVILCVVLLCPMLSAFSTGAEKNEKCSCPNAPIIRVNGLGATIYNADGSVVQAADFETILTTIVNAIPLVPGLLTGKLTARETENLVEIADGFFDDLGLDENGDPIGGQAVHMIYPTEVDHENGQIICFDYDWRLDPFDSAEKLRDFVEYIKKLTGHDKVYLIGESMGTIIMDTYLSVYGFDDISGVIWYNGGYKGILTCSDSFSNQNTISAETMGAYLKQVGATSGSTLLYDLMCALADSGFLAEAMSGILKGAYSLNDEGYLQDFLVRNIGRFPGFWSFIKYEDFDAAIEYAFPTPELKATYAKLIERVTRYHTEVSAKVDELMKTAEKKTGKVGVVCGYGSLLPPVTHEEYLQSDSVIGTREESNGATCAHVGETLGDGYRQKISDGHNHISPDNIIDASTCIFPDKTWFVKYHMHHFANDGYSAELIRKIFLSKGVFSVFSDKDYPQYMILNKEKTELSPLTAETDEDRTPENGFSYQMFNVIFKMNTFFLQLYKHIAGAFREE